VTGGGATHCERCGAALSPEDASRGTCPSCLIGLGLDPGTGTEETTRVDPRRDTLITEHTPIDYLDFASPVPGLGSKMGIDATRKLPGESDRRWGETIAMSDEVKRRVDALWRELGL